MEKPESSSTKGGHIDETKETPTNRVNQTETPRPPPYIASPVKTYPSLIQTPPPKITLKAMKKKVLKKKP